LVKLRDHSRASYPTNTLSFASNFRYAVKRGCSSGTCARSGASKSLIPRVRGEAGGHELLTCGKQPAVIEAMKFLQGPRQTEKRICKSDCRSPCTETGAAAAIPTTSIRGGLCGAIARSRDPGISGSGAGWRWASARDAEICDSRQEFRLRRRSRPNPAETFPLAPYLRAYNTQQPPRVTMRQTPYPEQ
jgi:hypothetical protein